jgi:hypothetical protein
MLVSWVWPLWKKLMVGVFSVCLRELKTPWFWGPGACSMAIVLNLSLCIIYHCTLFHMPGCGNSLVMTIKPKAKENIHSATILLFCILQKYSLNEYFIFFSAYITYHVLFQDHLVSNNVVVAHHISVSLPCSYFWLYESRNTAFWMASIQPSVVKMSELVQKMKWGDKRCKTAWWCNLKSMTWCVFQWQNYHTEFWENHSVGLKIERRSTQRVWWLIKYTPFQSQIVLRVLQNPWAVYHWDHQPMTSLPWQQATFSALFEIDTFYMFLC